ncbi:hypothetical protein COO60DRAFT_908944 [Scenedesmus sp. NREL 46B-D3]|nr:hypothetical protein COO60DRAFT_908944 [Scenedesmus sp. NREL 46B-D3]
MCLLLCESFSRCWAGTAQHGNSRACCCWQLPFIRHLIFACRPAAGDADSATGWQRFPVPCRNPVIAHLYLHVCLRHLVPPGALVGMLCARTVGRRICPGICWPSSMHSRRLLWGATPSQCAGTVLSRRGNARQPADVLVRCCVPLILCVVHHEDRPPCASCAAVQRFFGCFTVVLLRSFRCRLALRPCPCQRPCCIVLSRALVLTSVSHQSVFKCSWPSTAAQQLSCIMILVSGYDLASQLVGQHQVSACLPVVQWCSSGTSHLRILRRHTVVDVQGALTGVFHLL